MSKPIYEPWTIEERGRVGDDPPEFFEVLDSRGCVVGESPNEGYARLLAAAPELLAACRALLSASRTCGYDCEQIKVGEAQKMVDAAIAKAETGDVQAGEGKKGL